MSHAKKPVIIDVVRRRMTSDPEIDVFFITTRTADGSWVDGYGSESEATAYLRGIEALARTIGRHDIRIPLVPRREEAKD